MSNERDYSPQKKYLATRKQLRVWVSADKYEAFRKKAEENGLSVYAAINRFIDEYLGE